MEPDFQRIEQLQGEVKEAEERYQQYILEEDKNKIFNQSDQTQPIDTSDQQVKKLQQITADPLPISPGEWQGDV